MGSAQLTRNGEMKLICHCLLGDNREGPSLTQLLPLHSGCSDLFLLCNTWVDAFSSPHPSRDSARSHTVLCSQILLFQGSC